MKRRYVKASTRGLGSLLNYRKPKIIDAFEFYGPEITPKRERYYLKAI